MSALGKPTDPDAPEGAIVGARIVIEHLIVPDTDEDQVYVWFGDAAGEIPPVLEMLGMIEMARATAWDVAAQA